MKLITVLLAIVLALVATPAVAVTGQLFIPVAPLATDHFDSTQLAATMTDAGYPGADWDQYTSCLRDPAWTQAAPLWAMCWTALDRETGEWNAGYVEWVPAQFAEHGVVGRTVTP